MPCMNNYTLFFMDYVKDVLVLNSLRKTSCDPNKVSIRTIHLPITSKFLGEKKILQMFDGLKYMECKFSKQRIRNYNIVRLDGQEISMSSHFKYLGSIIQKDGEINSDVNHRSKTAG